MDPRNFVKVTILWMNFGNINFVCFTEEKLDLSLWAFGRLGVAVKFLRMLTPPLSLIVVLSLLLKTSWDCGKKSRNEGATIIHKRGDS